MADGIEILNRLIIGRVDPHIYAFTTNTIPNYLKVGDTYRPVSVRLNEWKHIFPLLKEEYREKAIINDDVFFRDYAVHQYLETDLKKERLGLGDYAEEYYSNEFFKETKVSEVVDAINDIKKSFEKNPDKYKYYSSKNRLPETTSYKSTGLWKIRPNQQTVIDNFKKAVKSGRNNLLMYAVMRFGKSFTSLCCAKEIGAKTVLIVSAKADVREEWKKTTQQAENFNKNYVFLSSEELLRDGNIVKDTLNSNRGVVIFLTLQDLQGDNIKIKHKEIFDNLIDLLIIDETHFGARAEKYGEVLKKEKKSFDMEKHADDDYISADDANNQAKALNASVKLHLSGTPYRILMGSEFAKEDIVAFCQFSDIVEAQNKWDYENIFFYDERQGVKNNSDSIKHEWDNPYYGFPQMIRFAFNPSKVAQEKLKELKNSGQTYAFSALFEPRSIKKNKNNFHKEFIHEKEVFDLFAVIDGSKQDDTLLGFLDYDKIKKGQICRHIVCVLPYCAACDALEKLIKANSGRFKNLQDYSIINISGVDKPDEYKSISVIKNKIAELEKNGQKTITLTVNRMLTGSTVEEWDTMLYLKDTASPQEYDQAIFRLQNQHIKTFVNENAEVIKFNMKPQTLLVDFNPHRMFTMQEQKSLVYNANIDNSGNQKLEERIKAELRISPIITMNKNKIHQVEATDILNAISDYSSQKGVLDESIDIPVDITLIDNLEIKQVIDAQSEIGSKKGLKVGAHSGDENELDSSQVDGDQSESQADYDAKKEDTKSIKNIPETERKIFEKKFRMYYSRLLFYAFLSNSTLKSVDDILLSINEVDNARIAKNLSLKKEILAEIKKNINVFILSQLDYKIQNINMLSQDESIDPIERANRAINKFGKLSESEVTTPAKIASEMVELLPRESFEKLGQDNTVFLDIASKIGEFAIAICKQAKKYEISTEKLKSSIFAIPTSSIAYEFTRKIYSVLGLDVASIATKFNSYDLLKIKIKNKSGKETQEVDYKAVSKLLRQNKTFSEISLSDEIKEGVEVNFEAIVGNPPYNETAKGSSSSDDPIYHHFMEIAYKTSNKVVMISPARFLFNAGKTPSKWNDKMLKDEHLSVKFYEKDSNKIFLETAIPGGIAVTYRDGEKTFGEIGTFISFFELKSIKNKVQLKSSNSIRDIIYSQNKFNLNVLFSEYPNYKKLIGSNGRDKRFRQIIMERLDVFTEEKKNADDLRIFGLIGHSRGYRYIEKRFVENENWIDKYKVFVPFSNGASGTLGDTAARLISKPILGEPMDGMTQTFIGFGALENRQDAEALLKYIKSKFCRVLLGINKVTQGNKADTWQFVPLQDFTDKSDINWTKSVAEIDKQLYDKYGLDEKEIAFIEEKVKAMD